MGSNTAALNLCEAITDLREENEEVIKEINTKCFIYEMIN